MVSFLLKFIPKFLVVLEKKFTFALGKIIKNLAMNKSLRPWIVITFGIAMFINSHISDNLLCLNYLYGGIKYTILVLLFVLCYYGIKQTIEKSIIISFLTWTVLNVLSYCAMIDRSQKNERFTTPPCKVTCYSKRTGKSASSGIVYIYKGEKQFLRYTNKQLDSLDNAGVKNWGDIIELRLTLSKVCESIYYVNDFSVKIKK